MRFGRVVEVSTAVGATRSRNAKAELLGRLLAESGDEIGVVVSWLSGEIPQGRLGVGWRTLQSLAATPSGGGPDAPDALTVAGVDVAFTGLAAASGAGSTAVRSELLHRLFSRATESEQNFLFRLMSGELRQGASAGVMSEAIIAVSGQPATLVRRAHMLTGSLSATARLAVAGRTALETVGLQVGRAISPMLATPADGLADALTALGPELVVDQKLDGARIQVHRDGDDVAVFTRTLNDVTERVPDLVAAVRDLPVRSVILDGETLTLADDGRPRPFQDTMSRFGSMQDAGDTPRVLRPFFFDCLHLDGDDLIDRPLAERLDALDSIAPQLRISSIRNPDPDTAQAYLEATIAAGHEGVMVKSLTGPYAAGRRGKAWQKVKPVHTLDLVVLACEWGSGRRTGLLSNLHLGARDPDGGPPVMVGKTFKGMTDALLAWQTAEFPRHEDHRDAHAVYLRPEIVVEIELDGAQRSSRYPGGVALRFARVVRYRPDKTPAEADTIDAVRALLR
ncbi:ATP-dependent DNA ligase [Gordonia desulfuricans]|nr:ATP-dependent DNA ligase [Gordonia desulfuricans]